MKKKLIKQISATICFGVVFLIIFMYLTSVFIPKYSYEQLDDYESLSKDTLDVFYIGTSHIACSIAPMSIWAETGIKSYNFSTAAQGPQSTYFVSTDALRRHTPKVVFLELSRILVDYDVDEHLSYLRRSMDQRLLTAEKIKLILELKNQGKKQGLKDYTLPLVAHHRKWSELDRTDFGNYDNRMEKGQRMVWEVADVTPAKEEVDLRRSETDTITYEVNETSLSYYEKTIELYLEKGVEVVLVEMPQYSYRDDASLAIEDIAKKYGVHFLDFNSPELEEAVGLDVKTDYYARGHLNPWGALTLTKYLNNYLLEKFDFEDYSAMLNDDFDHWMSDYEDYYRHYSNMLPGELKEPEDVRKAADGAK